MSSVMGGYASVWLKKHYDISNNKIAIKSSQRLNTFAVSEL
jgi:hypothetical protein